MPTLDLTGGQLDLRIKAGDGAGFTIPTPSDLSEWTWTGQIRPTATDTTVLGSFTFTLSTASAVCHLAATVTRGLPAQCVYDIQVQLGSGDPTTLLSGNVTVVRDVTR